MADMARGRYDLPVERPEPPTFATYREWYRENISTHKRNLTREASMLRTFDPFRLDQVTCTRVLEWRTARTGKIGLILFTFCSRFQNTTSIGPMFMGVY